MNGSTYWGTTALWGVFDAVEEKKQEEEKKEKKKEEEKKVGFRHFYLPKEVEESEKVAVVQAEVSRWVGGWVGGWLIKERAATHACMHCVGGWVSG